MHVIMYVHSSCSLVPTCTCMSRGSLVALFVGGQIRNPFKHLSDFLLFLCFIRPTENTNKSHKHIQGINLAEAPHSNFYHF